MLSVHEAGQVFVTPSAYTDEKYFYQACSVLRDHSPVHYVENDRFNSFYAITRHSDVMSIEARNSIFINEPRPVLGDKASDQRAAEQGNLLRTLIHVDDPEHRALRGVTSDWFLPKSLQRLESRLEALSLASVNKMAEMGNTCDFARDIAMPLPLNVILAILGLPESDYPRMLQLTQELFGSADEELQRGPSGQDLIAVVSDFFAYFTELTHARRKQPQDDLTSVVANAIIDGQPLTDMQTISYYVIAATAGHDTTSASMAGGMLALIENPDQLQLLKQKPELINSAVDEMIRWVTPVKHFMRTATEDAVVGDTVIRAGESVLLSYPSANRDEQVFDDPNKFDITRYPNKHLSFGFGIHHCLGAMLARMELKAFFSELIPRLESIELNGEPALMKTIFVGG
ncbi:MAG: cytochrome P450, partial [Actinobacteria bacterium]|nr:cytochrome P450 [Actinomycetota bacterium]